jgi:uncharacterized membrane protein
MAGRARPPQPDPDLVRHVAETLGPRLQDKSATPRIAAELIAVTEQVSGPLPPPHTLAGYEEIAPGSAQAIIAMAQAEQGHRHRLERLETYYPYCGLILGFLAFLAAIVGAVLLGREDRQAAAVAMLGVPMLGVIGWFIRTRLAAPPPAPPEKASRRR